MASVGSHNSLNDTSIPTKLQAEYLKCYWTAPRERVKLCSNCCAKQPRTCSVTYVSGVLAVSCCHHVIFRGSAFEALRQAMHARFNLFACVGGMHRAHRAGNEGISKFMNQTLRHVACFVSECMKLHEIMPDLPRHFEGYHVDMFSSDGDA
jgi:hypothetical protein